MWILNALNAEAYQLRPVWHGLSTTTEQRLVNRASFMATESHGISSNVWKYVNVRRRFSSSGTRWMTARKRWCLSLTTSRLRREFVFKISLESSARVGGSELLVGRSFRLEHMEQRLALIEAECHSVIHGRDQMPGDALAH